MATAKVKINMTIKQFKCLAEYLDNHEQDIALGINDFESLKGVFEAVFDERPKP